MHDDFVITRSVGNGCGKISVSIEKSQGELDKCAQFPMATNETVTIS